MEDYLTVAQVAALKGVSLKAVYKAIFQGRLPSTRILGRLGLKKADAQAWVPRKRTQPISGKPVSEETKRRISEAQKLRWATRSASNHQQDVRLPRSNPPLNDPAGAENHDDSKTGDKI